MSIVDIARGSQLQRLQSWSHRGLRRLRSGARLSLTRRSEQLAEAVTAKVASLGSRLADPELLRWSATLTHSAFRLYERALDAAQLGGRLHRFELEPIPERTRTTVAPAFVCDRALVESMRL